MALYILLLYCILFHSRGQALQPVEITAHSCANQVSFSPNSICICNSQQRVNKLDVRCFELCLYFKNSDGKHFSSPRRSLHQTFSMYMYWKNKLLEYKLAYLVIFWLCKIFVNVWQVSLSCPWPLTVYFIMEDYENTETFRFSF